MIRGRSRKRASGAEGGTGFWQIWSLTNSWGVVLVSQQDLGRRVGERAARGVELFAGLETVAEAKVGELDHALLLEEHHVLRLQVPVDHVQPVAVGYGVDNLGKVALGNLLGGGGGDQEQSGREI